jgi:hypothetical protein
MSEWNDAMMHILGAGMAGLIAAHKFRGHRPVILEAQKSLPHNHEALLRFRTNTVGAVTGVPFRECTVRKGIMFRGTYYDACAPALANMYSRKVAGVINDRSIWNLEQAKRYIAPTDFIETMATPLRVKYDYPVRDIDVLTEFARLGPVISTIPMPAMMRIIGWKDVPQFTSRPIWSVQVTLIEPIVGVYQTIYYPELSLPYYRVSLAGSRLTVEFSQQPLVSMEEIMPDILNHFGLEPAIYQIGAVKIHKYGKIAPINEDLRREFIYTLTREFGVYSLGRFATWRQLLLDDVVGDCDVIERLIHGENRRSRYQQSLISVKEKV